MRVAPQLALAISVTTAMVPIAAPALAQSAISPGSGSGSVVTLQPPGISDYWVTVSLQPGGVLGVGLQRGGLAALRHLELLDGVLGGLVRARQRRPGVLLGGVESALRVR